MTVSNWYYMKKLNRLLVFVALATTLCGINNSFAQGTPPPQPGGAGGGGGGGRGNFDPEQMRQRMMDRYREDFGIKSDDEWKLISDRVSKVMEARREAGGGFGGFGRGGRGGGPGGPPPAGGATDNGQGRRRFGPEPSEEQKDLQQALDSNASADIIKAKLAKFRDSQKAKEAKLEQAQEELKKVLTVKQEAAAVVAGLLK